MLSVDEALALILARAQPRPASRMVSLSALDCVLAEDVFSDIDSPPHDKSIVDGFALRSADLNAGITEFDVIEEVMAGQVPQRSPASGQATRIMTGAPIPAGVDAVVMIEKTTIVAGGPNQRVAVAERGTVAGQNITRRAASLARGALVLRAGTRIRPIEIGLLAEVGRSELHAVPRPAVAVLPTGNELVETRTVPAAGQIRNSNGPLLLAATLRAGAQAIDLGIGRDDRAELSRLITDGLQADLLIVSGGVSAGALDLVPGVLEQLGVGCVFHKVRVKPGKPLWFGVHAGRQHHTLVFGLPGNPVSSLVCFELFVRPTIARLAGHTDEVPPRVSARLTRDMVQHGDREFYCPARLLETDGGRSITPIDWRGSGDLAALSSANALARLPAGGRAYRAGDMIEVLVI